MSEWTKLCDYMYFVDTPEKVSIRKNSVLAVWYAHVILIERMVAKGTSSQKRPQMGVHAHNTFN